MANEKSCGPNREECPNRQPNGNCRIPGTDGAAVQCVGDWAEDKHNYIERYIEASSGPRGEFIPPNGPGGAAYIDLFSGPGIARIGEEAREIVASPLIALNHEKSPFTKVILADIDPENIRALRARTHQHSHRAHVVEGDCNVEIDRIIGLIPRYGLNIALIDPFALRALNFATLEKLADFKRMDFIIHFPIMDIKRNWDRSADFISRFLGTEAWKKVARTASDAPKLIDVLTSQLGQFGYEQKKIRSLPITNTKNGILYYLVYASKDPKGTQIWQSVAKTTPSGQTSFPF